MVCSNLLNHDCIASLILYFSADHSDEGNVQLEDVKPTDDTVDTMILEEVVQTNIAEETNVLLQIFDPQNKLILFLAQSRRDPTLDPTSSDKHFLQQDTLQLLKLCSAFIKEVCASVLSELPALHQSTIYADVHHVQWEPRRVVPHVFGPVYRPV